MTGHDAPVHAPKRLTPADFASKEPFPLATLAKTYQIPEAPKNPWQPFFEHKVGTVVTNAAKNFSLQNAGAFVKQNAIYYRETIARPQPQRTFFHIVAIFLGAGATISYNNSRKMPQRRPDLSPTGMLYSLQHIRWTSSNIIKLIFSIIIDLLGLLTFLIPGLGETIDVVWAPASAALVYWLYGSPLVAFANFAEEILPFTDFIPTATIAWFAVQCGWLRQ
ncbi:hypothetical protein PROFUN_04480 [Planoprotostelium fungivorum]|uniref:Uncharacterized protein n=1 Tax=Planoprotostelium fungivorum TaxID=1890364 RepID=A0A2P6NVR4_9EUKA|nr:hypothetical protein PROFUN_04480 [Planoprotostelium fungivorum]